MENIFNDMKALYSARHIRAIDPFMKKWIASDCVVMGTALGELSRSYNEVHALFDADLRYWYDLELFPERATRVAIGDYAYCTCPAESSYSILENDSRYNGYMSWCDDIIADATVSPTRRAAEIAFILDTLLSSRKNTRRKNRLPLTVRLIIRGEKAVFISFAYNKTMDTADHYMGNGANTAEAYARERSALDGRCAGGMAALIESQGFEDATVSRANGDIFYGVALMPRPDTQDEAMAKLLSGYKQEDAYRTLFNLRLKIAYMQKVYALGEHPRAVVRFFGVERDGSFPLFVPVFPQNYYMEWN